MQYLLPVPILAPAAAARCKTGPMTPTSRTSPISLPRPCAVPASPRRHPVAAGAHRTGRAPSYGPRRAADTQRRHARPAPATQHGHRRSDHVPGTAPATGRTDAASACIADTASGTSPRRFGDRQPARHRSRPIAAYRRAATACRSDGAHRVRPRACTVAHRLGQGKAAGTGHDPAAADDILRRRRGRATARCLSPGFRIGRTRRRRGGSRCTPPKGRVAELYAGCGTLTFALANHTRVAAWEGDAASASALRAAANKAGLAGRIEVTQRDLARQPLQARELGGFAAVVLDPPFAGAAARRRNCCGKPPVVIYVSCNPATLSRDARLCARQTTT